MSEEIICVLDMSGSMASVRDDALGGFKEFLKEQKTLGDPNITIIWFDDSFEVGYEGKLADMPEPTVWPIRGMTALNDAIGKTFRHVAERFNREHPEKVTMAILTDGEENDSKEFSKSAVADLIKEHQDKYNWDVIFLAADQDAWAVAQDYNIKKTNAINYSSDRTYDGFAAMASTVLASRVG